jgi:adenylate cyclase
MLVGISIGIVTCVAFCMGFLSTLQLQSTDFLFRAPDPAVQSQDVSDVIIVAIDDETLSRLGHFPAWPRSHYATLVDVLNEAGARVVALDVLIAEPGIGDEQLAESMREAGNVILPLAHSSQQYEAASAGQSVGGGSFVRPLELLEREALALGHASLHPDQDGIVRKLPVVISSSEGQEPALALAATAKYLRRPQVIESSPERGCLEFASRSIPLDSADSMIINYAAAATGAGEPTAFPAVSFADVIEGNADLSVFEDKIVLVGATASALGDTFWTPTGQMMNGVEIHASAVRTVLSGEFLRAAPTGVTIALMMVLAALCSLVVLRLRVLWASLSVAAACAIYLLIALSLFDTGLMLNMIYPPLALLGAFVGVNLYSIASERSQKRAIERTFGRYVSPPVVNEILEALDSKDIELGGRLQEATVAFADARGFTKLSEELEPDELVRVMNAYLSEVIEAVLSHGGMVNKFGGDSILAIWNAPTQCDDHALLATKAAVEAQRRIEQLRRTDKGLPEISFGIGINTGTVVAGNMGSENRLEYSVIGDTVNVASKLTSAAGGGKIWIGAETYARIQQHATAEPLEPLAVKGRSDPIEVYEVRGLGEQHD